MQWPDLVAALSYYMQQEQPDPSFTAATPTFVSNAELRIYRELDFLADRGQNTSLNTTPSSRVLDLTKMTGQTVTDGSPLAYVFPVAVESIAVRVGNRWIGCQACSGEYLDMVWPDLTATSPPMVGLAYYSMRDNQTALLAPVPDLAYTVRVTGVWRPAPMSASNPATWLGANLPDLLFAAVMVEAMGYQRDFGEGAQPQQGAVTWETRYQETKRTALAEERLRKGPPPQPAMAHPPTSGA